MNVLTILIILIHEHEMSVLLFVSSSISFINVFYFSVYRSFTSLVKFIPKYFTLFDAIVDGIVFLISLSEREIFFLFPEFLLRSFCS